MFSSILFSPLLFLLFFAFALFRCSLSQDEREFRASLARVSREAILLVFASECAPTGAVCTFGGDLAASNEDVDVLSGFAADVAV